MAFPPQPVSVQVQIIADKGQSFLVCANQIKADQLVTLMPEDEAGLSDESFATRFITAFRQTHLRLSQPSQCSPEIVHDYPYHGKLLHSEKPFLEVITQSDCKDQTSQNHSFGDATLPFPTEPDPSEGLITSGIGSFGMDDDQGHKRPTLDTPASQQ